MNECACGCGRPAASDRYGLSDRCYWRAWRAGALEQFPRRKPGRPGPPKPPPPQGSGRRRNRGEPTSPVRLVLVAGRWVYRKGNADAND